MVYIKSRGKPYATFPRKMNLPASSTPAFDRTIEPLLLMLAGASEVSLENDLSAREPSEGLYDEPGNSLHAVDSPNGARRRTQDLGVKDILRSRRDDTNACGEESSNNSLGEHDFEMSG